MLSFLYVYSDHSILECYNLFSGVELSMRSFFVIYVKKVRELIDKPLDKLELRHIRLAMAKVKCPRKLDISVFYQLTRRLPHKDLNYDDERLSIHFYDTFCNESIKLLGKMVRCRTNVLYHLLDKIGKEPNADLFQFMKGPGHQ